MSEGGAPLKIAVIGDIHGHWSRADAEQLNGSGYDAVLLTGDLPTMKWHRAAFQLARRIAPLRKPAYMIPGNHDGTTTAQIVAEVLGAGHLGIVPGLRQHWRVERLRRNLAPVTLAGYSSHALGRPEQDTALLVARPHAMGGGLSFGPYLRYRFAVRSMGDSVALLKRRIDERAERRLVVLAHNGPQGLGNRPTDIWGCDFKKSAGDWGDADLHEALEHAERVGKRVLAVVAGHMHLQTKKKLERHWLVERDGVAYVNAAQVPRVRRHNGRTERHHIALTLDGDGCGAEQVWL